MHFGVRISTDFSLEVSEHCGIENHKRKISNNHQDFWIISTFHEKRSMPNCPGILILHSTQSTYYLTNQISCQVICFQLSLSYLHQPNFTQWNLNYKKLLKCVNATRFYRSFKLKKRWNCCHTSSILISNLFSKAV